MRRLTNAERCFVGSVAVIAYTYVGFPALVALRAGFRRRPWSAASASASDPTLSVLIAAHNEETAIATKIRSVLDSEYTPAAIEVIVVSDGSDDSTVACVEALDDDRVTVIDLPRVGKAEALETAIARSRNSILVFTDANSRLAHDALRQLVAPLADPDVGGVAGDQRYEPAMSNTSTTEAGERGYWSFDRWLKHAQSIAGNVTSATGALYAIRRELCPPVPLGVTDDFAISTAVVAAGRRLVFAHDAHAYEVPSSDSRTEFDRKVRIMMRGLRGVWLRRELLDPRRSGFYAVQLWSHKVLRRLMVVPLLLALASSVVGSRGSRVLRTAAACQGAAYGLGAAGLLTPRRPGRATRLLDVPAYFVLVNAASLVAVANLARGRRIDRWQPTSTRHPSPATNRQS